MEVLSSETASGNGEAATIRTPSAPSGPLNEFVWPIVSQPGILVEEIMPKMLSRINKFC